MKNFVLLFIVAVVFIACKGNAGGSSHEVDSITSAQKENALKDSANFTTAEWTDSVNCNMGKIKKGQTIEIPYTIKNIGDKPLLIIAVEPSCGCTVADKPEKPVMPGKSEKIVAKFNSENQSAGPHTKSIVVRANTKPFTDHILSFNVEVVE